jgi:hypothetical protein
VGLAIDQSQPAQAFALTGGSSSLFDAHGASMQVRTPDYTGRFDLGYINGPSFDFFVSAFVSRGLAQCRRSADSSRISDGYI